MVHGMETSGTLSAADLAVGGGHMGIARDYSANPYASTCDSIRANSLAIRDLVDTLLNAPASY